MNPDPRPVPSGPMEVVLAWWQAIADNDLARLAEVLSEDHISTGGPGGRILTRAAALAEARAFLADGDVAAWSVRDVVQRDLGNAVICSYAWQETGRHLDSEFSMTGYATDVVAHTTNGWAIRAHHTSVLPKE